MNRNYPLQNDVGIEEASARLLPWAEINAALGYAKITGRTVLLIFDGKYPLVVTPEENADDLLHELDCIKHGIYTERDEWLFDPYREDGGEG